MTHPWCSDMDSTSLEPSASQLLMKPSKRMPLNKKKMSSDKDADPEFLREHGHLGTMGEHYYVLNGLPRLVNKNE